MISDKNILIISSTFQEIEMFLNNGFEKKSEHLYSNKSIDVLICGVGILFSTFNLTKHLATKKYDLAINVGIAGSFNCDLKIGETVHVTSDCFADFGIEFDNEFQSIFDTKFVDKAEFPFANGEIISKIKIDNLKSVKSITVNRTSGSLETILERKKLFSPDIETMEGASIMYVCAKEKLECIQIRSISNIIDERSNQTWNVKLAIENLNKKLVEILKMTSF